MDLILNSKIHIRAWQIFACCFCSPHSPGWEGTKGKSKKKKVFFRRKSFIYSLEILEKNFKLAFMTKLLAIGFK